MKLKPSEGNKTFCMAPWTHSYISPQSERRICCASTEPAQTFTQYIDTAKGSGEYTPMTLEEHWNSDNMKSIRARMLRGETLEECKVCDQSLLHTTTYRNYFNSLFGRHIDSAYENTTDDGATTLKTISFDYRFSNLCNFKCRMCGSMLSSQWEAEERKHNMGAVDHNLWMQPDIKKKIQTFTKNVVEKEFADAVESKQIEEVYWVGGEPLMYEEHWKYMKRMVDIGHSNDVHARYNSNLSRIKFKGIDLFKDLLINFKSWQMCASIDGTGEIGEYIRTGLDWQQWKENFEYGLKFANHKRNPRQMQIDFTLTTPGLFEVETMFDLSLQYESVIISKVCFAFSPDIMMAPMCLPRHILDRKVDEILANIEHRATWRQQGMIDMLKQLKNRPTFEEQWPNEYKVGFMKGRSRLRSLEKIREQKTTFDEIMDKDKEMSQWWNREM
tara:strand:+ start:804 stop:2132 length:1329 start_codon:yes stop_codon:yes gene_type:complete